MHRIRCVRFIDGSCSLYLPDTHQGVQKCFIYAISNGKNEWKGKKRNHLMYCIVSVIVSSMLCVCDAVRTKNYQQFVFTLIFRVVTVRHVPFFWVYFSKMTNNNKKKNERKNYRCKNDLNKVRFVCSYVVCLYFCLEKRIKQKLFCLFFCSPWESLAFFCVFYVFFSL